MKEKKDSELAAFKELVELKYRLYNGLLLDIPIRGLDKTKESLLFFFQNRASDQLYQKKQSPLEIVENFFQEFKVEFPTQSEKYDFLFKLLQLIERQVVLFDALEDSAFEKINNFRNSGSISYLESQFASPKTEKALPQLCVEELKEYKVRIVLTAHPTQFYTDQVLGILFDLGKSVDQIGEIKDILLQLGYTRFSLEEKPSPLEEAKSITWYLKHVFYETMPKVQRKIYQFYKENLESSSLREQSQEIPNFVSLELGFWPGGDRDGNPFVTSETTLSVLQNLRASILELYIKDLYKLQRRLTFPGLINFLEKICSKLKETERLSKLLEKKKNSEFSYQDSEEFLEDLFKAREILSDEYSALFLAQLDNLIYKVKIFGFYFASLDLRQDSSVHSSLTKKVLQKTDYSKLSYKEKVCYLQKKLLEDKNTEELEPELELGQLEIAEIDLINLVRLFERAQQFFEQKALHRYVISNTQNHLNLLELFFLFHTFFKELSIKELNLDIIPLFETIVDLERAGDSLLALYQDSFYRSYLKTRNDTQTIMLGFSDGTKDGGYVSANWNIFKAKKALTAVSQKHKIKVIFFDGRGGPPARGGGDTYNFYSSLAENLRQEEIHLTIQGQTISSNYGTENSAAYNFEQLFTAGIEKRLFKPSYSSVAVNQEQELLLEELSEISQKKYEELKTDSLFLEYLEKATPLNYYSLLKIASRPSKRKQQKKLSLSNLRAIPFVGSWTQMKQNILGFYGLGTALKSLSEKKGLKVLIDLYEKSLFFKALIGNSMQSICKSDLAFSAYLQKTRFRPIWDLIYQEITLTEELILQVTRQKELLTEKTAGKESILFREKIVFLAGIIEHFALQKISQGKYIDNKEKETLEKIILKAMPILVNASRNSV